MGHKIVMDVHDTTLYMKVKEILDELRLFSQELIKSSKIVQELAYIVDVCFTVLQFKNNKDARELGKYTERLLTEWRQDAVSYLRPLKSYKGGIKAELEHRYPELEFR